VLARRGLLRVLLAGIAVALAVPGLAGCRTSPTVAAYVGDTHISVAHLNAAIAAREDADPTLARYARSNRTAFTRQVLGLLVTQDVYAEVSRRYGVHVGDSAVRARITQLLADSDPVQVYGQLAAQGIGKADVFENVRQQLVRQEVAAKEGLAGPLSDSSLQARYEQTKNTLAQKQFGFITVPDQATADSVLATLTADPTQYPAIAAQYPGQYTQETLEARTADQIPSALQSGVSSAAPNTGFTLPLQSAGGVVVVFVGDEVVPTFEEVRAQLAQQAASEVDTSAQKLVDKVRSSLHVTVNPRYGVLQNGSVAEPTGGVVDILGAGGSSSSTGTGGSAATGTPGG
jgi:peptidyl-prolyl cis-trans isomerase SurA